MFDAHAHVAFDNYDQDRPETIKRASAAGVTGWLEVGTGVATSKRALLLAYEYYMGASIGVHPSEVARLTIEDWQELEKLLSDKRARAVGEVGLDYYRGGKKEEQVPALEMFLKLAVGNNKPVIFHVRNGTRDAHEDLLELLESLPSSQRPSGVVHMFSGTPGQAERYLNLGYYISFSGVLTFKNAGSLVETALLVPLDRALVETDSPYVAPEPHRGQRNEPSYVKYVVEKLAQIKGEEFNHVEKVTSENAFKLFKLNELKE